MARAFAKKFYSSGAWRAVEVQYARDHHYLCENCLRKGIYRAGEIVHHKIELDPVNINNPEIALNPDNLELLCRNCHAEVHKHSGGRWAEVNERKREQREAANRYTVDEFGRVMAKVDNKN